MFKTNFDIVGDYSNTSHTARMRVKLQQFHKARNIYIPKILMMALIASLSIDTACATDGGGYLDGIGYREQELQVAKGSFFQSEEANGVQYASFAGGTHIFIKGVGLADNAQSNTVVLYSDEFQMEVVSTPLTEDDAFNSHPMLGSISYRLPAIDELFGLPMNFLDKYQTMTFTLSLIANTDLGAVPLKCQNTNNCKVLFRKTHTPVIYYLSPPIVYYDSYTEVWFDPKNTQQLIQDLASDEMPFINTKVGGSLLDFEFNVDDTTTYSGYYRNRAKGQVGELPIGESYNITMQWETGQGFVLRQEATHCSYDNKTCFQAQAVPVIFETSSKLGYTTGGQILTISGYGFDKGNISAKVDGQDCVVSEQSLYSFTCKVASKAEASVTNSTYVGSNGLRRHFINETNWLSWSNLHTYNQTQSLALTMQAPYNEGDKIGNIYKGWFVAPATTRYRFYLACDDYCSISMGNTTMVKDSPTELASTLAGTDYRDWWETRASQYNKTSEWVSLKAGEYYYIEAKHLEGGGGDHFSAAVEIEQSTIVGHHHAMKEVQYLSVQTDQVFELTKITISNMDAGEFLLVFQNPNDLSTTRSSVISASATAAQLSSAVYEYYRDNSYIRSLINTNLTWYDVNGNVTTNQTEAVQSVYFIQLRKLITGSSASSISAVKTTTKATIKVEIPSAVQLSGPPLSGNYRIKCVAPDGTESYSADITISTGDNWVNNQISNGCDRLYDLTEVFSGNDYEYAENGMSWILRFIGLNADPGQFEIVQSETTPLTGGNITFFANTTVPYGTNLFYEPIPFEMLRTYETEPQLIVSVGNLPAVCHNLTCDFTYILPEGEVTAFTFDESSKKLVLTGTNMPSVIGNISKIEFALSGCTVDESTLSATTLECTLSKEPTCGDHLPILTSFLGVVPNAAGLTAKTILCTITGVNPSTGVNLLGGDNITISGTNLPHNLDSSTVSIKFSDSQQTTCVPQVSSTSSLVCLTSAFDTGVSAGQTLSMTVEINSQTVTNTYSITMKSDVKSSTIINPASVSPVLKTNITVTLQSDFPNTLTKESLSINATSTTNSSYVRYLNVIEVDDTAKTFVAIFGGAESGTFQISIRHSEYGLIGTTGLILDVSSSVTSYSPTSGSIYGGTLLTITGTNFGTVATDNPVQISQNGGVGSVDCFVQETSATQIKCRVNSGLNKTGGDINTMIVFLKTSEEATCEPKTKCEFTWTSFVPVVTSAQVQFDATSYSWQVKVAGTGFTGDTTSVELLIADVKQTTTSVSSTEAIFTISNVSSSTLSSQKLYFDVGIPASHSIVEASMTLTPKLVSISPNSGSVGGSLITAVVPGASSSVTIVDSTGTSICQSVQLKSYGVVECKTLSQEIASTQLSVKEGTTTYACVNTDTSLCQYEQLSSASFPAVTSVAKTDSTIVFTGTNFDIAEHTISATFSEISADTVVVDSSTQATATFNLGVPVASEAPILEFTKGSVVHYAPSASSLTNVLAVTASISGLECSFAGGCSYDITSTGLASIMRSNSTKNYVSICDEPCIFDESSSSTTVAKCKVPKLSTIYSNENYAISSPSENLKSGNYFGTASNYQIAFDDMMLVTPTDTSSTCYLGTQFKVGHVGVLSQVKYFMKDITSKALFVNTTSFQGSNDGTTYTTLFQMDENLHEGWNYYKWETASEQPKYRFYRFYAQAQGACAINEITFTGVETIDDSASSHTCTAKLMTGTTETALNSMVYQSTITAALDSISPRFGTVTGGTVVTFSGTGFSSDTSKYTITIDGIICPVSAATTTSVTCTTGKRPGLVESSLQIFIDGQGLVSNKDLLFRYVSVWSSDTTWGGEFAPMEGESVWIPRGLNLLVDVDSTPILNAILVEGSLIFAPDTDPTHHRFFDAHYIFVNGGLMEVGTEEFRYTSKITITMHSSVTDPYLPIYGNKVIGVRYGTLDMHGPIRTPTWTMLETTADANSTVITLQEAVDWQVGEEISIAATSFQAREGERRRIAGIDSTKKIITLDRKLDYKHFAATETYGSQTIDMRAEVGLLSRNVVYRGDPETSSPNEYGATIFLHSQGDDSLTARLSYIECTDVGQAFKLGRYAIHFHMIGAVHRSYAKGLAVHQGFNRAFTLHGTHYLRLLENVAFEIKGHTIFIEDAIETNNYIYKNLIMKTMRSMSLLNTDQTPACFWITHPNNIFIDNHAAGSDRYGFWYDLQTHSTGPSADTDICPENSKVGEFRGNSAHSMGRYGLRIFHNMVPRKFPCSPIVYDENVPENPYWKNPPITANFDDFTGWKNNRNGAIAERVGDVRFNNFKTADNLLAGIEFSLTDDYGDGYAQINGALIVGKSSNTEELLDFASPHGVITPRTENFQVKNVKFHNFNWNDAATLGSCSHCFHPAATDSGARTVTFSGLEFTSVTKKIRYQYPWVAIYYDLDGTLTGKGAKSWATFFYAHHNQTECEHLEDEYNGVVCTPEVQIRRIAFWNWKPNGLFSGMGQKIIRWDDDLVGTMDNATKQAYIEKRSNYGTIIFKPKLKPTKSWATPFVTGHKYKIHWGLTGLDFEQMQLSLSQRWEDTDKPIYLVHNFTDVRQAIEVRLNGNLIENNTIAASNSEWKAGHNLVLNDTETRELHLIVNGFNQSSNPLLESNILLNGIRCVGSCTEDIVEVETESEFRYWSDVKNWPNETLPKEGEDVHVLSGWKMILDIPETPKIKLLRVNGLLIFSDEMDVHLKAKHVFVRAGELHIGNETNPYQHNAKITLYGEKNSQAIVYDNAIEAGNKNLANVGTVKMFGKPRKTKMTRLLQEANKGDKEIFVETGLDLIAGDRIALLATSYKYEAGEDFIITSYDNVTGKIVLEHEVHYNHWGASESTASTYNGIDIRGEVILLSRNIQIVGEDIESWGCQMVTSDTVEYDAITDSLKFRTGQMILDNIEMYNCSQIDTFKASIRFENAVSLHSSVTNSAFHNGQGWGANIKSSANILMQNNVWFGFRPVGVAIDFSKNITFDSNVISHVTERLTVEAGNNFVDKRAGLTVCQYLDEKQTCSDITVTNNLAAGITYAGFIAPGHACGDYSSNKFKNNIAHSVEGFKGGHGALIYPDPADSSSSTCFEGSYFTAYKCYYQGAYTYYAGQKVIMSNMNMIDNRQGFGAAIKNVGDTEYKEIKIELNDNKIYGESPISDCPADGSFCKPYDKYGVIMTGATHKGKDTHITGESSLPVHKIKSLSAWGTVQQMSRNQFIGFDSKTALGMRQAIFQMNEYQPDYLPMMEFFDSNFIDVKDGAVAYIMDPIPGWANLDDCGNYPCTAPKNALLTFQGTTFTGVKPRWAAKDFQIIANNSEFAPYIQSCEPQKTMNAYVCEAEKMGILLFESLDEDRQDRSMQPIYVKKQGTGMENNLNAMMDHVWDGFYTGQIRLQRFPSVFQGERGSIYDLNFTGTPAKHMRFTIRSQTKTTGSTIRIAYPGAESRAVYVDGNLIQMNQWDDSIQQYGEIKQRSCGENRYIGVKNILEFYLTSGCKLEIKPRNAIQTLVRMEWTMEAFFANGGTTNFIDRLTASLGIHASTVKIVSVYEGSLIVNYEISVDDDDASALNTIKSNQQSLFESGSIDLGAPILAFESSVSLDASASSSSYTPVTISTPTYQQNNKNDPNVFNPDLKIITETQVTYKNTSVEVLLEPETVIKTETIIVDSDEKQVVKTEQPSEQKKTYILEIAISVLGSLVVVFVVRFVFLKKTQERLDVERQIKRTVEEKKAENDVSMKEFNTTHKIVDEFEQQYDPNNDFAIFGVGNPKQGGIQDMQEKMNMADKPQVDSESSDTEDEKPKSSNTIMESKGSKGSDESGGSGGQLVKDQLPEDKEIHSDQE